MYTKLNSLVRGREVVVIAPGAKNLGFLDVRGAAPIRVRFNNDLTECDIWATAFFSDDCSEPHSDAKLIVSTVPNAEVQYWNPARAHSIGRRDFRCDIGRYTGAVPLEVISANHWRQLSLAMPIFPLSGIAMLSMLSETEMSKCTILGFDFYTNMQASEFLRRVDYRFRPCAPFFLMHDYTAAIGWLGRLIASDKRFVWLGDTSLEQIQSEVASRIRFIERRTTMARFYHRFRRIFTPKATNS